MSSSLISGVNCSFASLGVELFAFGEGLFAEPGEAGDEGVERGKVRVGAAGVEQEARLEEALDGGLEGIVGVVGFGEEFVDGFLVLVVNGLVFRGVEAAAKEVER